MRPPTRSQAWLLVLASAGGAVDVTSYLGIGKVFTANMTGNTVLLTVALAHSSGPDAARSAVALGGFCAGVAVGVLLVDHRARSWPARARWALLAELVLLVAVLVLWGAIGVEPIKYELIVLAGVAMGVQSAAVRASDIRGVNTTYMTSTLLNAIARLVGRVRSTPPADEGPSLPGAAWLTYGCGALAGAFALSSWHAGVLALPLAIVGAIAAVACRPRGEHDGD